MDNFIKALEESMRDCALDGVTISFKHLLNAYKGDEMRFAQTILEKMREEVPQWLNCYTMNTDIKRLMQKMIKDVVEKPSRRLSLDEKVQPWQIDYSSIKIGDKIAEGHFGEVFKGNLWGKVVAIKKLKKNIHNDKILQKLEQEAAMMR